jgi:hypothetical protein
MRCTAKSKQSGEQCKRHAVPGRNVCAMHGGKSPGGLGSATLKSGKYSKYLPQGLAAKYAAAVTDPEILALNNEIALVDARAMELLDGLNSGEATATLWNKLQKAAAELDAAQRAGDAVKLAMALNDMLDLIRRGAAESARWLEIYNLFERRRRLVDSERKRRMDMQTSVNADQIMILVRAIADLVNQHVTDRDARSAISTGLANLITARATQAG